MARPNRHTHEPLRTRIGLRESHALGKMRIAILATARNSCRHNWSQRAPDSTFIVVNFDRKALLELETRARRTGRETSDCNSRERLGRALVFLSCESAPCDRPEG